MADNSEEDENGDGGATQNSQSKKGRNGIPQGQSQCVASFKSDLAAELQEELTFTENGKERKITRQRAIIRTLIAAAIKDIKAVNALLACMRAFGAGVEERTAENVDLEDLDLLETYLARQRKQQDRSALGPTANKPKTYRARGKRK
jgi:hypothetical protein